MPISRAGEATPSDTCKTARNGRCEDGLYFSLFNVNDETWSHRNEKDTPYTAMCQPNSECAVAILTPHHRHELRHVY